MEKIYKTGRTGIVVLLCFIGTLAAHAQSDYNRIYFNIDWQLNLPVGDDYANRMSGWGMNAELGYYVTDMFSVGPFVSWHTNHKYIDRRTINVSQTSAITTDQQHSLFQVPFGAAMRYTFTRNGLVEPYFGSKIGANYSETSSYMNIFKLYERKWGFYIAPEFGTTIFFTSQKKFGLHLATYFSYATNKTDILDYSIEGLTNWGIRIGAAF